MAAEFLTFFLSLGILLLGANYFINSAINLAQKFRISPVIIGATALAVGTSLPETMVALLGSLRGESQLVLGNIIGASIADLGLILGLSFVLTDLRIGTTKTQRISLVMLAAVILFALPQVMGGVGRLWGIGFLSAALIFLVWEIYAGRRGRELEDRDYFEKILPPPPRPLFTLVVMVTSLLAVFLGSQLLINSALNLAVLLKIRPVFVGLTLVSFGTVLPELTTTLMAIFKKEGKLAIGTLLGTVIYNCLLVGGIATIISPARLMVIPLLTPLALFTLASSLLVFTYKGRFVPRVWGLFLVSAYLVFLLASF